MPGFFAHGTTFSFGGTMVAGLTGIDLPDESKDDVELTTHGSAGDREYIPGLREGGNISLEGANLPADTGQTALRTNYKASGVTVACIITLPVTPAVTYTFQGYTNALGGSNPFDDKGAFSAGVKVAGPVTKATAP